MATNRYNTFTLSVNIYTPYEGVTVAIKAKTLIIPAEAPNNIVLPTEADKK